MEQTTFARLASTLWAQEAVLGLVLLRIDRFAAYETFHGAPAAAATSAAVLRTAREQLRGTTDRLLVLGPAAAAVLLPDAGEAACGEIAERLRAGVEQLALPHLGLTPAGLVTVSTGAASLPTTQSVSAAGLVTAAERALSAACTAGGNCGRIGAPAPAGAPIMAKR